MANLSHRDLSNLGTLLGYKNLEKGICRGFSMMWVQAVLAGEEDKFFERLAFINEYKLNFKKLKEEIEAMMQRKNKQEVGEHTQKLLDIIALFDGISLYLVPDSHREFFPSGTNATQENFDAIYPIVKSKALEDSDLSLLMEKVYAFNGFDKKSLKNYLRDLKEVLQKTSSELPILLESNVHSTALRYDKSKDCWYFIDTNHLDKNSKSSFPQEMNDDDLVDSIVSSFNPFLRQVAITTKVFGNKAQPNANFRDPTSITEDLVKFDLKYPITSKQTKIRNLGGSSVLHLACRLNQIDTVKDILKQQTFDINGLDENEKTPLRIACFLGLKDIVALLIKDPNIQINLVDKRNTNSFFSACQWGHLEIAKLLLDTGKIDINYKGINGHSPLQIACLSPSNVQNKALFELLLEHQASLTCLNDEGQTALDIALEQGNKTAISTLLQFIESQKINPYSVISSFSLEKLIDHTKSNFPEFIDYLSSYTKKEDALDPEIEKELNNFNPNLINILKEYLKNAKRASLENEVIKIPLSCIPVNNIKPLQTAFKECLGKDCSLLMVIENDTLEIKLSPSKLTDSKVIPKPNPIKPLDWQIEFHAIYKELSNKKNKLNKQVKSFVRQCEEFLRINSNDGELKPNIQIPTQLQTQYQNIKDLSPYSWRNGVRENFLIVIESFFSWISEKLLELTQHPKIKDEVENTQLLKYPKGFFNEATTKKVDLLTPPKNKNRNA